MKPSHLEYYVMRLWILFKPHILADFPCHHSGRNESVTALLLPGGSWSPLDLNKFLSGLEGLECLVTGPLVTSTDTTGVESGLLCWAVVKSLDFPVNLLWHYSSKEGLGCVITAGSEWESRSMDGGGTTDFSAVFGQIKAIAIYQFVFLRKQDNHTIQFLRKLTAH